MTSTQFTPVHIISIQWWADNLCSIVVERPSHFKFTAGQFARVGVRYQGSWLFRALSVVSSPYADKLEFLISIIPDGLFSAQIKQVTVDDVLALENTPYGYLTLARFQSPIPNDLWLLATGTGVAPFLSMLQDFSVWQQYQRIILAYSVRHQAELAYSEALDVWQAQFNERQIPFTFVPIITRESYRGLTQRLPLLIESGTLESYVGCTFDALSSHILLCGNPQMVEDTRNALKRKGLTMNRKGEGNIAVENYW